MKKRKTLLFFYILIVVSVLGLAGLGSRVVTVIAEHSPVPRGVTIVIDPGHGGEDGGATSCTGRLESTYNLEIALRLNDLLHLLGYDTRMIRTVDTSVYVKGDTIAQKKISDLKERVRIINGTENALLLSIHQNQFSDPQYSGAQVFYAQTSGSDVLAKGMQTDLVAALNPGSRRKSKLSKGVYIMERIQCPGVLIECGFLSNPGRRPGFGMGNIRKSCAVSFLPRWAGGYLTGDNSPDIIKETKEGG